MALNGLPEGTLATPWPLRLFARRADPAPVQKPPDLERRIDELLNLPASAIRLPPDIHALYQAATARNARVTVMRWSILAACINVSTGAFDVFTVPRPLLALDLSFRLIISLSFLLGALLFRFRPLTGIRHAVIILPCLLMVGISGIIGLMSGDHVVLERFVSYGFITLLTAIMFFPIPIKYTIWMAVLALALTAGYVALAPINLPAAKCQIIAVYAGAALSLIWGRHVMNQYLLRLFLLNTREELRASRAARENEQLTSIAYTDPLTNIPTRRYFDEICAAMSEKTKNLFPLSLCMIDIDHFKALNDSLGHLQGDRCLRVIAAAISGHLRKTDIVARYGGEEFVLLLPGTDREKAVEITERVRAAIVSLGHPNPGSPFHMVTASFGVATVAQPPLAIEALITEADTALYRAKMAGRNRVSV